MNTMTRMARGYELGLRANGAGGTIGEAVNTLALWRERARQRRHLRSLTPAQLQDIGVSAAAARFEAAKGFWQA